MLYNNADTTSSFSLMSSHMIVTSNGNVTWLTAGIFRSSCEIDVRFFPFDIQNCSLKFGKEDSFFFYLHYILANNLASWTFDGSKLNLLSISSKGDITNFMKNGEWILLDLVIERNEKFYTCCPNSYPDITIYILFERRPHFIIYNMILPYLILTFIAFLGFLIPPDSGEVS